MAKFYGRIGFTKTIEIAKDVWEPLDVTRYYTGDLIRNQRRWSNGESINEDLDVSNEISVLADDFIQQNLGAMKWVEVMGYKWKINSITLEYPRIRLTLGGVYNGG